MNSRILIKSTIQIFHASSEKRLLQYFPCGLGLAVFLSFLVNLRVFSQANQCGKSLEFPSSATTGWLTKKNLVLGFYSILISGNSLCYYSSYNNITHYQVCLRHFYSMLIVTSPFIKSNIYLNYPPTVGAPTPHTCKTRGPQKASPHIASSVSFQQNTSYVQSYSIGRNWNLEKIIDIIHSLENHISLTALI